METCIAEENEEVISKEKISNHYQEIKDVITSALLENSFQSDNEREMHFLHEVKAKLNKINDDFKNEILELEESSEWDTFCISFFGETNAGKSTIIDTLRILYNEESRLENIIENQKEVKNFFIQNNESYANVVHSLNQLKKFIKEFSLSLENKEKEFDERKVEFEKEIQAKSLDLLEKKEKLEKEFYEYKEEYEMLKKFYQKKRFSFKTLFFTAIISGLIGIVSCLLFHYFI